MKVTDCPQHEKVKISPLRSCIKHFTVSCPQKYVSECLELFPYEEKKKTASHTRSYQNMDLLFLPVKTLTTFVRAYQELYPRSKTTLKVEQNELESDMYYIPFTFKGKNNKFLKKIGIPEVYEIEWNEKNFNNGFVPIFGFPCSKQFFNYPPMGWTTFLESDFFKICYNQSHPFSSSSSNSSSSNSSSSIFPFHLCFLNKLKEK